MKGILPRARDTGKILGYSEIEEIGMDEHNSKLVLGKQLAVSGCLTIKQRRSKAQTRSDPFIIVHT